MEKLQLYSPRRLCYNSLVLGVSRCTGQEISACRDVSFGRSKLGRSKLGRNGDCSGTSAPIRLKKKIGKRNDSAETLTVFDGITLKTIRSNFAAGARAVPLKQRDEECHSANCVSFCIFVWSLARRSSHQLCQPVATRRQEGWKNRQKTAWIPLRSGRFEMQEKRPPRPRQRSLPCARAVCPNRRRRNSTPPIRSRCGSKNTGNCFRSVSSCSRVQRPGVHRRHRRWQGARPTRYRTDRGKSKKRQVSGRTAKR